MVNENMEWSEQRAKTMMSRLDVDIAYYQALANVNDEDTSEGKIARTVVHRLRKLQSDIAEIRELVE